MESGETVWGKPDLKLRGLSIWTLDRPYPDAEIDWDADQITCRVVAEAAGARVELNGTGLSGVTFHHFLKTMTEVHERLDGYAILSGNDLGVEVKLSVDNVGHVLIDVSVEPEGGVWQKHTFYYVTDQTELPHFMAQCRRILEQFPLKVDLRPPRPRA